MSEYSGLDQSEYFLFDLESLSDVEETEHGHPPAGDKGLSSNPGGDDGG